jgi:hypothetical protein
VVRSALVTFQRWNRVKMTLLQFPLLTINLDEAFQELLQVFDSLAAQSLISYCWTNTSNSVTPE